MSVPRAGDTIFALSSGPAPSAIAIVRVSGPDAGAALDRLVGRRPPPRRASRASVRAADGGLIDRALLLWFPGPATATGEDVAEFHVHGGRAVIAVLLDALAIVPGCRPALPGEFTRRAYLNDRIDLTAAEGLADLLEAETADQHARALRVAEGGLARVVERWRVAVLDLSARVEAAIEFGESEDDVAAVPFDMAAGVGELLGEIEPMLTLPPSERLRDGFRVVVAGPTNAGKSSLINALAERAVALATPLPGTTRDVIEAPVRLGGNAVLLIDTAGLRESDDVIERLGIARARDAIDGADLILWCGDVADCPDPARSLMLYTRADERPGPPPTESVQISIKWPATLAALRAAIDARCSSARPKSDALIPNLRQRTLIGDLAAELGAARREHDLILIAEHLRACRSALDSIVGRTGVEDMFDSLFGRFCLGK